MEIVVKGKDGLVKITLGYMGAELTPLEAEQLAQRLNEIAKRVRKTRPTKFGNHG